jgi:hypothetical protein
MSLRAPVLSALACGSNNAQATDAAPVPQGTKLPCDLTTSAAIPAIGTPAFVAWAHQEGITNHANNALLLLYLVKQLAPVPADSGDVDELAALLDNLDRRLHAVVGLAVEPPLSLELEEMHADQLELGCPGCQNGGGDHQHGSQLVEVSRHYDDGSVNDFEPIPDRYELHAQFNVTALGRAFLHQED